jgi:hypothetical protein
VGQLSTQVARDVQAILKSSELPRYELTEFLTLAPENIKHESTGDPNHPALLPLEAVSDTPQESESARSRKQVYQQLISAILPLSARLSKALHDLRAHERLLKLGLGDLRALPLDVVILADLTETWSSGALFPLIAILQHHLTNEPYARGHLLLSTAMFPPFAEGTSESQQAHSANKQQREAELYATLQELDALADRDRPDVRQNLAEDLQLASLDPLPFRIYLFDHLKDGTLEVKDHSELRLIMGNFLLTLLLGGLAHRLAEEISLVEIQDRQAYYSGAGATALIFDPQPLIHACAARLGAEFLATECAVAPTTPGPEDELSSDLIAHLGNLRNWWEHLVNNTSLELRAEQNGLHLGLHFADLGFESLREEDWASAIVDYSITFAQEKLPSYQEKLGKNLTSLKDNVLSRLAASIDTLPQSARAYPGGLQNTRRSLETLIEHLAKRADVLSRSKPDIISAAQEEADLEALREAAQRLFLFPSPFDQIIALLNRFLNLDPLIRWWRYRNTKIVSRRDRCVRNAEQKCAAQLDQIARNHLTELCQALQTQIIHALESLAELETMLSNIQEQLEERWQAFPPADSPFRILAVDLSAADWAYRQWQPPAEKMRHDILEKHRLFAGWQEISTEALMNRLLSYGREIYAPVADLALEDILQHRDQGKTESLLPLLAQGTVPLLRPDFDVMGGSTLALTLRYLLICKPNIPDFLPVVETSLADWEIVSTGNSHFSACCLVRHLIPLAALHVLTQRGKKAYEALRPDQLGELCIFDT